MATTEPYGKQYFGNWYKCDEAQKIQTDLQKNSRTGDSWIWRDELGREWTLSGSS